MVNWGLLSLVYSTREKKNGVSAEIYVIRLQTISAVLQNGVCANISISIHWVKTQTKEMVNALMKMIVTWCSTVCLNLALEWDDDEIWRQIDVTEWRRHICCYSLHSDGRYCLSAPEKSTFVSNKQLIKLVRRSVLHFSLWFAHMFFCFSTCKRDWLNRKEHEVNMEPWRRLDLEVLEACCVLSRHETIYIQYITVVKWTSFTLS